MRPKKIDADFGVLVINWTDRKVDLLGLSGMSQMAPEEVLDLAGQAAAAGYTAGCLVLWRDNKQLSLHDTGGFMEIAFEEDDTTDDADPCVIIHDHKTDE